MVKIPHSRPFLGWEEKKVCAEVIDTLYLAGGPRVEAFEAAFAQSAGRKYAVAVSSGTAALAMALKVLVPRQGRNVVIPSYTCAALLHALDYAGQKPLITDIDAADMNMSAADLKKRLKKNTAAVIVPHLFGRAADMKAFERVGLPLIEDGTQALGARADGQRVGSFGELSIFSFYATKMITSGEGGMIVTDSSKTAETLRDMRDYDKKDDYRFRMNFKMSDLQAAIGLCQLKKLSTFVQKRIRIAELYDRPFAARFIGLPAADTERDSVYFRYVLRVPGGANPLIKSLNKKGIEAKSPIFKPLHEYLGLPAADYPETVRAMREACSLPIFPAMTTIDVRSVINAVLDFAKGV